MFYIPLCECARYIYKFMARIQYCYLPMSVLFLWTQSPPPPQKKTKQKTQNECTETGHLYCLHGTFSQMHALIQTTPAVSHMLVIQMIVFNYRIFQDAHSFVSN